MKIIKNNLSLVFRTTDFYLQGFIRESERNYYHFTDSTITTINNYNSRNLRFESNYNQLVGGANIIVSRENLVNSFTSLNNRNIFKF